MEAEIKRNQIILRDLVEVKRQLFEAEAKEMKNINKKNLAAIKGYIQKNPSDKVVSFVLDSLTKFFVGLSSATYAQQGSTFFTSVEDLQQNIRKVDHGKLESDVIKAMMTKMCGGDGSDGGEIADELSAESNISKYLAFFPYFKTLSKMCHLAMTVRKEMNQNKKISNNESKLE